MEKKLTKEELKVKFLDYYSALPVQKLAAGYIGKDEDTILRWKKEDPEFADLVSEAASAWAKSKAAGVKSKEWLLERVMNDHFGQRTKQDITSGGEKIIPILGGLNGVSVDNSNQETSPTQKEN